MFFVIGLTQIKIGVSYVWLSECVGFGYKSTAFTIINVFEGLTLSIVGVYYLFISRDWYNLCLAMLIVSLVATALIPLCPESPRWLLTNGLREEAITELNWIARLNGQTQQISESTIFVEDPTNYDVTLLPSSGMAKEAYSARKEGEDLADFVDRSLISTAQVGEEKDISLPIIEEEPKNIDLKAIQFNIPKDSLRRLTFREMSRSAIDWDCTPKSTRKIDYSNMELNIDAHLSSRDEISKVAVKADYRQFDKEQSPEDAN